MKLTNMHDLPEAMVRAVMAGNGKREGYSITDLDNSPRQLQLSRRHWDELEEDVSDRLWALLGKSVHYILEKGASSGSLTEESLTMEIDGFIIGGHSDIWKDHAIEDYKVTSVWAVIYNPKGRKDWHSQLNMYVPLWKANGFDTNRLKIWAILRDWVKTKALYDHQYPKIPVIGIEIPIWGHNVVMEYIRERIKVHQQAIPLADDDLPFCTSEETWEKKTVWAVMKEGRKSAIKLCDSLGDAQGYITNIPPDSKLYIQERKGACIKCDDYCACAPFCNQYKKYKEAQACE